jgi:hypothetical protein
MPDDRKRHCLLSTCRRPRDPALKLFGEDAAWTQQVLYLIRRCAICKLNYRLKIDNRGMAVSSDWMGSFILLFSTFGDGTFSHGGERTLTNPRQRRCHRTSYPVSVQGFDRCDRMPAERRTTAAVGGGAAQHGVAWSADSACSAVSDQEARIVGGRVIIRQGLPTKGRSARAAFVPPVFLHARSLASGGCRRDRQRAPTYRRAT